MNKPLVNHLLLCLMEECAEVALEASKAQRFGLRNEHKSQSSTPEQRLNFELNDLYAVVDMLKEQGVSLKPSRALKADKVVRLKRAMKYSRKQGML